MAYVANQNEEDDTAQNVATNLFAQNQGGQQQPQTGFSTTPATAGGDQSSSIDSGSSGASSNARAPMANSSASSSKEVVRRNQDKMKSPIDIGAVKSNISKADQDLQSEANAYTSSQAQNKGAVGDDVIERAVKTGDDKDFTAVSQRLNQSAPQYQNFAQKTNTDFSSDINKLEDSQLRNYFKQAGGPQASVGDAAFDTMLLNKNKQFKQDRDQAKLEAVALDQKAKDIRSKTDTDAKSAYEQAYGGETDRIKGAIKAQVDPIKAQAEAAAAAENARRAQLGTMSAEERIKASAPDYQQWLSGIADEARQGGMYGGALLGDAENEASFVRNSLSNTPYDKLNFINVNQSPVSANNFINPEQAAMLQRSRGLVGDSGPMYSSMGPAGETVSKNKDAASAYLRKLIDDRRNEIQTARVGAENSHQENLRKEADQKRQEQETEDELARATAEEKDAIFNPANPQFYSAKSVKKRLVLETNPVKFAQYKGDIENLHKQGIGMAKDANPMPGWRDDVVNGNIASQVPTISGPSW